MTPEIAAHKEKVVVYEPRYFKVMPWVLIAAALALALITLLIRTELNKTSVVIVQSRLPVAATPSTSPAVDDDPVTRGSSTCATRWARNTHSPCTTHWTSDTHSPCTTHWTSDTPPPTSTHTATSTHTTGNNQSTTSSGAKADALPPEKKTTTEVPPSDTMLTTLLGIAAALLVLGAFYTRISKVTIAGNTVEFNAVPQATREQDSKAIEAKVSSQIPKQVQAVADERGAISTDDANRIAQLSAAVAARLQQEATHLRAAASVVTTVAGPAPTTTIQPDELKALGTGMPLPESLLDRLADTAFKELEEEQN